MRRWTVLCVAVMLAGCGGEKEKRAAGTATSTPTPTPAPVQAATSATECQELWNANAHGGSAGQKAPEDYLAEVAPTQVAVDFFDGNCIVIAPVKPDARRVYVWVAPGGRAPYGQPGQSALPPGRDLRFNARATAEGQLE